MKIVTLKQAVEHIEFTDDQKEKMIQELNQERRMNHHHRYGMRAAAAIAVCIIGVGLLSVPVRALVSSLVRERMEEVPREEIKTVVEQIDSQKVGVDGYSRPYTEAEKARMEELYEQYVNGTFPAGEIPQVDSEKEAQTYEFCFLTTTSVFYLPADRELTDEEILEKIDFEQKRNYALRERYEEEHAEEIAAKEAAEKEQIAEAIETGGVTEEQAVEIATDYLERIFGLDGDGLELNHYYDADAVNIVVGEAAYCVNWSDLVNGQYYYFWISVADGSLLSIAYSGNRLHEQFDEAKPTIEEAPGKIAGIKEQAEGFLTDKIGIQENYDKIRSCYRINSEGGISGRVYVLFVKADSKAYLVECGWDGTVDSFGVTTEEAYEESMSMTREVMARQYTEEYGREVSVENVWN